MDKIDLNELERLAAQASPGPWSRYDDIHIKNTIGWGIGFLHHPLRSREESEANVAYIVAACNAVPELIARVRELERQSEALAFWLAQFLPHAECPLFEDCPLSHKKNVDVRDCAKQLIQGVLDHD